MTTEQEGNNKNVLLDKIKRSIGVFSYIRPYWLEFTGAMILLALGSLIFMALMGLPGEMTNTAIGKPKFDLGLSVRDYGWLFLGIMIIQGVFSYVRTVLFAVVSEKGMADLRKDVYNKMITQQISFFEERRVGELTSRITADVEQLQTVFSITLAEFIRQLIVMLAGIVIIFLWTPDLSMVMLMIFPIVVIAAMIFGKYIRKLSKKRQDQLAETNTIVEETFQSFAVVKSFGNELYESLRYARSVDDIVRVSLHFAKIRGLFFIFIITVLFGAIFYILWRGALMVQAGSMESGDLFSFIIYTSILGGAIASFGTLYTQIIGALGATERILDILGQDSELDLKSAIDAEKNNLQGDITFESVLFSYPTRKDVTVLKGIDISIKPGEKIALVGQSGSGKSTIVQLLFKFYNPDQGKIVVDGKDIREYNVSWYRNQLAVVPQEVLLFGGTILENIAYGNPKASFEEIKQAARLSNSLEFIESFPDGFHTIVGERGVKLSGGQRQRIAIARAILKNPKILILDEATSSLDAESEKLVQEALEYLMEGRTSIIVAHRLSTIRNTDKIYVIENGRIAESGTHNELIKKPDGAYAQYAKLQFDQGE